MLINRPFAEQDRMIPHPKCSNLAGVRLTLAFVLVAISSCNGDGDHQLADRIGAEAQNREISLIKMSSLTDFPWENLFVFGPYTPAKTIEKALGFRWSRSSMIEAHDGFSLIVFVNSGEVVRFVKKPRVHGDFAEATREGGYFREQAVFRCLNNSQGWLRCMAAD
jgi:hypothetical protein